jgi:hypothetical protein
MLWVIGYTVCSSMIEVLGPGEVDHIGIGQTLFTKFEAMIYY